MSFSYRDLYDWLLEQGDRNNDALLSLDLSCKAGMEELLYKSGLLFSDCIVPLSYDQEVNARMEYVSHMAALFLLGRLNLSGKNVMVLARHTWDHIVLQRAETDVLIDRRRPAPRLTASMLLNL